jgi:hypothetical protein
MRVREALRRVIPGGGRRREFTDGQLERARVIKALHATGATLSQLARASLTFDDGQAFVVYDGHELRTCPNTAAAIPTVVRARRPARPSISLRSARILRNESAASWHR